MTLQYSTTEVIAVGTNLAVNYEIPFSFAWLDENDIKVYRTDTNSPVPDAQWQFKTRQSIEIIAGNFAEGETYIVRRETQVDEPTITFAPGSAIRAEDLNNNQLQVLYQGQELNERSVGSQGVTFTGTVIVPPTTSATPSNAAATKAYVDASQNYNDTQLANSVAAAAASANTADGHQQTASDAKDAAVTAKNQAVTAQSYAEGARDDAQAARDLANNYANTAAAFSVDPVFYGFKRHVSNGRTVLRADYSLATSVENATLYDPDNYNYKDKGTCFFGTNGLLYTSGPNIGQPKFAYQPSGHVYIQLHD